MINNPWIEISDESRVLSIDIEQVEHYNGRRSDNPICSEDFPEPFLGRKGAEIYLLLGNPGFDPTKDVHSYSDDQKNAVLRNLKHQNENEDYPHYLLNAKFDNHPGYAWWHAVFQPLMKELSLDKATIAKKFFLYGTHRISY